MAENAIVKILTALLKHQVKKVVGDETLGVIGQEIAALGGDKVDAKIKQFLGDQSTVKELEKATQDAQSRFHDNVEDHELEQWIISLPLDRLPEVTKALEELPTSSDESKLEIAIRDSIALNWKNLSKEQVDNAVNTLMKSLRDALLPLQKQTLMVIGRSVLRTEDKVDLLLRWFEQYIITGKPAEIKQLNPEPVETWNLKHPYAMPPNFTGRVEERKMFIDWLNNDNENRLFILRALGGFGKSALSWHWLTHDVDSKQWTKVLWWSFYEGDASFEHFIEETLKYLKLEVPQGQRPQVDALLKAMKSQKILLIMDGFERALRAYSSMNAAYQEDIESPSPTGRGDRGEGGSDCVNINTEIFLKSICSLPNMKSKVLMTTRLTPRIVKPRGEFMLGCREEELTAMPKADAVEFFHKQKIKGTRAEIEATCAPYGYHPLSLRILAGLIIDDRETPGDIAVAKNIDITDDIIQNKHHVLEVAYNTLSPEQQKLLSNIACFRFPIEYAALKIISGIPSRKRKKTKASSIENLGDRLKTLETRGLLQWDRKSNKYDLHPIVRRYAYKRLTALEHTAAHERLVNYFEAVPQPEKVEKLEDLAPVIELYHHTVRAGKLDEAIVLFRDRLNQATYFQFGTYQLRIELMLALFLDGEDKLPRLKIESAQGWVQNELANSYALSGQPHRAVPLYEGFIFISETRNDKKDTAIGLGNMAHTAQLPIGALRAAERNQRRSIDLCREIEDEVSKGVGHQALGRVLSYRGIWQEAEQELNTGLKLFEKRHGVQSKGIIWSYRALCFLLMVREQLISNQSPVKSVKSAIESAERALELADETAKPNSGFLYPIRDYIRAYWLLGAAYRANSELDKAEENLFKAISMCRQINMVDHEADILLDLARLRYDQKKYEEAKNLADEALLITERCGYVLQGADVNLFLAQYALEQEQDKVKAKEYAETALKLATCDGPPYYYKVAYEEAERFLENLK